MNCHLKKNIQDCNIWQGAYMKLFENEKNNSNKNYPFLLMSNDEYSDINSRVCSIMSTKDIINLFSFGIDKSKEFNRFNIGYSVWDKPFIRIGDKLFCPMMFFANNDWFYAFAQAGIKNLNHDSNVGERKRTSELMEQSLGDRLSEKGWAVKVINNKDANKINGDVDVIVEDESASILIQLKRTYFRLNDKDIYYESLYPDGKASQQLNDAEAFLKLDNEVHKLKHDPLKWIVTTSYENVLSEINGCTKVNYFDLLNVIKDSKVTKLIDLIDFITKDKLIKSIIVQREKQQGSISLSDLSSPISLVDSQIYREAIFRENKDTLDYNKLYNNALSLSEDSKKKEAIELMKKCIELNPNDIIVYSALANIYADIKDYTNAYFLFEKALKILPNDPFIMRNYAITLKESGKYYESLEFLLGLYEMYPFVGDIKTVFINNLNYLTRNRNISIEQEKELFFRWKELN